MPLRFRSYLPAITWFVFITVLFLLPGQDLPDEDWFHKVYLDKWVHSGFFCALMVLMFVPLYTRGKLLKKNVNILSAAAILYGVLIEFIQLLWIPNRSFDVLDMCFDALGVAIAWWWVRKK